MNAMERNSLEAPLAFPASQFVLSGTLIISKTLAYPKAIQSIALDGDAEPVVGGRAFGCRRAPRRNAVAIAVEIVAKERPPCIKRLPVGPRNHRARQSRCSVTDVEPSVRRSPAAKGARLVRTSDFA